MKPPINQRTVLQQYSAVVLPLLFVAALSPIHVADAFVVRTPTAARGDLVDPRVPSQGDGGGGSWLSSASSSRDGAGGDGRPAFVVDGTSSSPSVELVDPATQCRVVLLGCFHGTASSAQDVRDTVTVDTDVVVLELCAQRFAELQRGRERAQQQQQGGVGAGEEGPVVGADHPNAGRWGQQKRWWPKAYLQMVSKTVQRQGLATGMAAGLLGGVSGLQSALSGFTPGLEFTTTLDLIGDDVAGRSSGVNDGDPVGDAKLRYNFDIILADQDVDETLRKLGNLPATAREIVIGTDGPGDDQVHRRSIGQVAGECRLHLATLGRAIFGDRNQRPSPYEDEEDDPALAKQRLPQVQLVPVLLRNQAAVQDLIRLALPTTMMIIIISRLLAAVLGADRVDVEDYQMLSSATSAMAADDAPEGAIVGRLRDVLTHILASGTILTSGFLALVPIVKVILTERDEILTEGIRAACRRAGNGGQVVAVLGLLHVNGVARRMLMADDDDENDEKDQRISCD